MLPGPLGSGGHLAPMLDVLRTRNVAVLAAATALGTSANSFSVLLTGILGSRFAPDPRLATLPVTAMILGIAASTVPAVLVMRRFGRRRGFLAGAAVSLGGALVGAVAVERESLALLCLATLAAGVNTACVAQYRFAAAESVPAPRAGAAISVALLGTLVAAFLGPELVERAPAWRGLASATVAYGALAAVQAGAFLVLTAFRDPGLDEEEDAAAPSRPLAEIVRQPDYLLAAAAATVGYGVMTFLMTATPISMHLHDGHALGHTARVIQLHIVCMYLPSLVSGPLLDRLGERGLVGAGLAVLAGCLAVALRGHAVLDYAVALGLLGVGWNFLFVGGTALLTRQYRPRERFRAQAANDLAVFSASAAGSLAAGVAVSAVGWRPLVLAAAVPIAALALALLVRSLPTDSSREPVPG